MVNGSFDYFERYTRYTMQTSRDRYFQTFPDTIQDLDDLGGPCTGRLSLHPFTIGGFKWFESCEMEASQSRPQNALLAKHFARVGDGDEKSATSCHQLPRKSAGGCSNVWEEELGGTWH